MPQRFANLLAVFQLSPKIVFLLRYYYPYSYLARDLKFCTFCLQSSSLQIVEISFYFNFTFGRKMYGK